MVGPSLEVRSTLLSELMIKASEEGITGEIGMALGQQYTAIGGGHSYSYSR